MVKSSRLTCPSNLPGCSLHDRVRARVCALMMKHQIQVLRHLMCYKSFSVSLKVNPNYYTNCSPTKTYFLSLLLQSRVFPLVRCENYIKINNQTLKIDPNCEGQVSVAKHSRASKNVPPSNVPHSRVQPEHGELKPGQRLFADLRSAGIHVTYLFHSFYIHPQHHLQQISQSPNTNCSTSSLVVPNITIIFNISSVSAFLFIVL